MLHIYCEGNEGGHTEALFVSQILNPYLHSMGRPVARPIPSGGLGDWERAYATMTGILRNPRARLTTLIDYYGMPKSYPRMPHRPLPPGNRMAVYAEVARLEQELAQKINDARFIPYYSLHEFEALAFAYPEAIVTQRNCRSILPAVRQMLNQAQGNPELINDSATTSPSHRLQSLWPKGASGKSTYKKTVDSIGIVRMIPFPELLAHCRHFQQWVAQL